MSSPFANNGVFAIVMVQAVIAVNLLHTAFSGPPNALVIVLFSYVALLVGAATIWSFNVYRYNDYLQGTTTSWSVAFCLGNLIAVAMLLSANGAGWGTLTLALGGLAAAVCHGWIAAGLWLQSRQRPYKPWPS